MNGMNRRAVIGATLASPIVLKHALGETPIKIGMPLALTGPAGEIGLQMRHGAEFWAKETNAAGGILGRCRRMLEPPNPSGPHPRRHGQHGHYIVPNVRSRPDPEVAADVQHHLLGRFQPQHRRDFPRCRQSLQQRRVVPSRQRRRRPRLRTSSRSTRRRAGPSRTSATLRSPRRRARGRARSRPRQSPRSPRHRVGRASRVLAPEGASGAQSGSTSRVFPSRVYWLLITVSASKRLGAVVPSASLAASRRELFTRLRDEACERGAASS